MKVVIPAMGGRITTQQDGETVGKGNPPKEMINMLLENGNNGIVIDGIISWVVVNKEMTAEGINKLLLERFMDKEEIMKSRIALKTAGGYHLEEIYPDITIDRREPRLAVMDIVKSIRMLSDEGKMPLVLASPDQMRRCPPAGSCPASVPELENRMKSLENCMTEFMEKNKKQMEDMVQEVKKSNKKTQEAQGTTAEVEVPTISSQGMEIRVEAAKPSFTEVAGIQPSGRNWPPSQPPGNNQVLKTALEKP